MSKLRWQHEYGPLQRFSWDTEWGIVSRMLMDDVLCVGRVYRRRRKGWEGVCYPERSLNPNDPGRTVMDFETMRAAKAWVMTVTRMS